MIFLAILDTVHALIGFLDVTASTVLLRVMFSELTSEPN